MGSMLQDEEQVSAAPMTKQMLYYSAGLGFLLSPGVALDLAYNYSSTEQTDYNLYYFESPSGINGSGIYNTKLKRHFAALSLSFRF
jgi:opacity protein-like surface antigen